MIDVPIYIWWLLAACLVPFAAMAMLFIAYLATFGVAMILDWHRERGRAKRNYEAARIRHEQQVARVRQKIDGEAEDDR